MTMTHNPSTNLRAYAQLLIENGYNVYAPNNEKVTYLIFEKNGVSGYIQYDIFDGYWFSTNNAPDRKHGTGLQIITNASLTLENAEKTIKLCVERVNKLKLKHRTIDLNKSTWLTKVL